MINFYDSELGQIIYSWRGISVEPLIEQIKDVFKIDPLPVRGYHKAAGIVLLSVLIYQIMVLALSYHARTNEGSIAIALSKHCIAKLGFPAKKYEKP